MSVFILILLKSSIRSTELRILNVYGNVIILLRNLVKNWAILYAGARWTLITGLMVLSVLCNFIKPCIDGGLGFKLLIFPYFILWNYNFTFISGISYGFLELLSGVYVGFCEYIYTIS
jgi:hypothetical protein